MQGRDQSGLNDQMQVRSLYKALLENWNMNNAEGYANLFTEDAILVGFDGSQMNGMADISNQIGKIFTDHKVGSYVSIVREVRQLAPAVFVLSAVAGMVSPGQPGINPAVNAIQTLVAVKQQDRYRIVVFQNTPAAYHDRPELARKLTDELGEVLAKSKGTD